MPPKSRSHNPKIAKEQRENTAKLLHVTWFNVDSPAPKALPFVVPELECSGGNFAVPPSGFRDVATSVTAGTLLVSPKVVEEKAHSVIHKRITNDV